ncbi:MAG: CRTAC1 family protein [Pirellulaceae bacterium]
MIDFAGRTDNRSGRSRLAARTGVIGLFCCLAAWAAGCRTRTETPAKPPLGPIVLRDMSAQCGVTFRHTDGSSGQRYIVESVSAGLATFDYDNDGLNDIYFLNGAPLRGAPRPDLLPVNALYRNEGGWRFTDVSHTAGVADLGYGLGVTVGDYDNDGHADLYLNNYGPNVLYHNNGDGTFTDVTAAAGVGNGDRVGAGAAFLDADNDGDLDLYVANYVDFTYENHVSVSIDGLPAYAGPRRFRPIPHVLFRNEGDGTFSDFSLESGVGMAEGTGMGMVCADYDDDGDADIFVCNDSSSNFFFRNDGTGQFEEVAAAVGAAYDYFGDANASMAVDCSDFNNDGRLDFYMTDYSGELPVLYENVGNGFLNDVTRRTRAGAGLLPHITWGCGFVDFDSDGDRDLYVACGHIDDNVQLRTDITSYRVRNVLLANNGDRTFSDISHSAGDGLGPQLSSRGAAFDDLDNDGDSDVVVLNSRDPSTILCNESEQGNGWVQVRLTGVHANRDGVGSRVTVAADDLVQIAEVHAGRGYQGHFGTRLHFGLGKHPRIDRLEVRWAGGETDVLRNVPANCCIAVVEGGTYHVLPLDRSSPPPSRAPTDD